MTDGTRIRSFSSPPKELSGLFKKTKNDSPLITKIKLMETIREQDQERSRPLSAAVTVEPHDKRPVSSMSQESRNFSFKERNHDIFRPTSSAPKLGSYNKRNLESHGIFSQPTTIRPRSTKKIPDQQQEIRKEFEKQYDLLLRKTAAAITELQKDQIQVNNELEFSYAKNREYRKKLMNAELSRTRMWKMWFIQEEQNQQRLNVLNATMLESLKILRQ